MKITDMTFTQLRGQWDRPAPGSVERQAQARDIYPEFNQPFQTSGPVEGSEISALYLEIHTDEGISGLWGPIEHEQAYLINRLFQAYLIERDPLAIETLSDQMIRQHRHGRSGLIMTAISAVDCALWDLKGRAWDQPVYRLLGGPTRPAVPAYASMLGFAIDPASAAQTARDYQALGFTAQKWFFRYGPGDGAAGKQQNLAMATAVREAVGPHYTLMFDAYMGWDATYTIEMAKLLAPLMPHWIEEPIPPERVGAFRKIRDRGNVPLATGEHAYTRWQFKELLAADALDFVQADPDWTGGISELVKICALSSAFEVPVVAHGHSLLPALHVAGAQSPGVVPFVEYLITWQPVKQFFHAPVYEPENGMVHLPTLPGLGITLAEDQIQNRQIVRFD